MVRLGEARAEDQEAVSCLAFSSTGMLLISGHVNGGVAVWEWHRTAWQNVKQLKGAYTHACPAVAASESV